MANTVYTTTFAPKCGLTAANVIIKTDSTANNGASAPVLVNNAHTGFDWFTNTVATNNFGAKYAAMDVSTVVGVQNKAFMATIAQMGKTSMLPLLKAEYFASTLAPNAIAAITTSITNCKNNLVELQKSNHNDATKTSLIIGYNANLGIITAALNRIKTAENKIHLVGDSIDSTAAATDTAYATAVNTPLTSFTTAKVYLSNMFDPAYLALVTGNSIPALSTTLTVAGNAAILEGYYTTAASTIAASTTMSQLKAFTAMASQNVFDTYCASIQGYASSGTTGKYTGTAPVGIVPGIDYSIEITGDYATGTASSGTAGAPSAVLEFWA